MRYFIIYSGKDYPRVKRIVKRLKPIHAGARFSMLSVLDPAWKKRAAELIDGSDKMIFFASNGIEDYSNLKFELQYAAQKGKEIYVCKLDARCNVCNELAELLHCTVKLKKRPNVFCNVDRLSEKIQNDLIAQKLHNRQVSNPSEIYLRQYDLFVKTSEDLVKRKQTTNNIYVTLNLAILSILIAIAGLNSDDTGIFFSAFGIDFTTKVCAWMVVGCFGVLICISWQMMLRNYERLNSGKMSLIIEIERALPLNLFHTEWQYIISNNKKGKYASFSRSELLRAKLFLWFYIFVIFGGVILICRQFMYL